MLYKKVLKSNLTSRLFKRRRSDLNRCIEVLQTFALPLGYDAISDSTGNRTRVTAVKGPCLNRLTTEPF